MMCAEVTMESTPVTMASVLETENLRSAWQSVKGNKGAAGVVNARDELTHFRSLRIDPPRGQKDERWD
jgi:hypothetical protein